MILHWLYFTLLGSSSKQATLGKYEELKDREIIEEFEKNEKEGKVNFNTIEEIKKIKRWGRHSHNTGLTGFAPYSRFAKNLSLAYFFANTLIRE